MLPDGPSHVTVGACLCLGTILAPKRLPSVNQQHRLRTHMCTGNSLHITKRKPAPASSVVAQPTAEPCAAAWQETNSLPLRRTPAITRLEVLLSSILVPPQLLNVLFKRRQWRKKGRICVCLNCSSPTPHSSQKVKANIVLKVIAGFSYF